MPAQLKATALLHSRSLFSQVIQISKPRTKSPILNQNSQKLVMILYEQLEINNNKKNSYKCKQKQ